MTNPTIPTISLTEVLNPSAAKERKVSLLSVELSRERIRNLDREIGQNVQTAARVRAVRRARRDARIRALRVRRLLLAR
jgi:uncharacterized iron-regulated protein